MRSAAARINFDSVDPPFLSHFWAGVTGYRLVVNEPAYIRLQGRGLGVSELVFREVERWKATPNRVQLDLVVNDLEREAERLIGLGATKVVEVEQQGERRLILRDPEGNEFALIASLQPLRSVAAAGKAPSRRSKR